MIVSYLGLFQFMICSLLRVDQVINIVANFVEDLLLNEHF